MTANCPLSVVLDNTGQVGRRRVGHWLGNLSASVVALFLLSASWEGGAQAQPPVSGPEQEAAVSSLAELIEDRFFDRDRGHEIADGLRRAQADGELSGSSNALEFADAVTQLLSASDRHFAVEFIGHEIAEAMLAERDLGEQADARPDRLAGMRRSNFRFTKVEILPGNVGYIEFTGFAPIGVAEETARAALGFVGNADAIIVDLRNNRGGSPSMVQYLVSHFLEPGGGTLINTFVSRNSDEAEEMWSLDNHPAGHRPETPLFVLTSPRTISAAEAFPYHLQALNRGTIVGEVTYGAGNPGETFIIEEGYSIFISTGSTRNPVTGTNWEGVGVQPDIVVPSNSALDRAIAEAHSMLGEQAADERVRRMYTWSAEEITARLNPIALNSEALETYVGNFGQRRTWVEDGQLMYQREGREPNGLIPLGDHRFMFADDNAYRLVFRMNESGVVEAMDLQAIDGQVAENRIVH